MKYNFSNDCKINHTFTFSVLYNVGRIWKSNALKYFSPWSLQIYKFSNHFCLWNLFFYKWFYQDVPNWYVLQLVRAMFIINTMFLFGSQILIVNTVSLQKPNHETNSHHLPVIQNKRLKQVTLIYAVQVCPFFQELDLSGFLEM